MALRKACLAILFEYSYNEGIQFSIVRAGRARWLVTRQLLLLIFVRVTALLRSSLRPPAWAGLLLVDPLAPRLRSACPTVLPEGSLDRKQTASIGFGAYPRFAQSIQSIQGETRRIFQTNWIFGGTRAPAWFPVCRSMVLVRNAATFTHKNKQNIARRYVHEKKQSAGRPT